VVGAAAAGLEPGCAARAPVAGDPCDPLCPVAFKAEARKRLREVGGCNPGTTDDDLRRALLKFIADFANWDNAAQPTYLEVSRALVKAAHAPADGGPYEPPLVVDPFAGGGSIPLEALRLGCEVFASPICTWESRSAWIPPAPPTDLRSRWQPLSHWRHR